MTILQRDAEKDRKVKALIELANYHWKQFDGRRVHEWKANFALWAALAALAGILNWKDVIVPQGLAWWTIVFLFFIVLIYWLPWQTGMWRRNLEDTEIAKEALERVRIIVGEPLHFESKLRRQPDPCGDLPDYVNVLKNWSRGSQLAFTVGFALLAATTVWYHTTPAKNAQQSRPDDSIQSSQPPSQNSTNSEVPILNPGPARP